MGFRNNAMSFLSGMFNGLAIVGGLGAAVFVMGSGGGPVEAGIAGAVAAGACLYGTFKAASGPRAAGAFSPKASGAGTVAAIAAAALSAIPFMS